MTLCRDRESTEIRGTVGGVRRSEREASTMPDDHEITLLLGKAPSDVRAQSDLLELVYDQLRAMRAGEDASRAGGAHRRDRALHEVHALLSGEKCDWNDSALLPDRFECMRRPGRSRPRTEGREAGGGAAVMPLSVVDLASADDPDRVLALDEALATLASEDARAAEIVKLRFFAGLNADETAKVLGLSERTVMRDWAFARARLFELMGGEGAERPHPGRDSGF